MQLYCLGCFQNFLNSFCVSQTFLTKHLRRSYIKLMLNNMEYFNEIFKQCNICKNELLNTVIFKNIFKTKFVCLCRTSKYATNIGFITKANKKLVTVTL